MRGVMGGISVKTPGRALTGSRRLAIEQGTAVLPIRRAWPSVKRCCALRADPETTKHNDCFLLYLTFCGFHIAQNYKLQYD
jgi:hypothetical protein